MKAWRQERACEGWTGAEELEEEEMARVLIINGAEKGHEALG